MKKRRQNAKGKQKRRRDACCEQNGGVMVSEMRECGSEDSLVDRISMFPDDLLELILSHLTVKEWVATSILSRRWRYMWTSTARRRLDFDGIDSLVRLAVREENGTSELEKERLKYVSWVNHVLASRKDSNIEDFKLHFDLSKNDEGCIDEWLRYALARKVQTLELNLSSHLIKWNYGECYVFPYRFLRIDEEIHFKQLKKLLLDYVQVDGENLKFFLHNCPLLEDLSVSHSLVLSTLSVTGPFPSLKRLEINSCLNLNVLEICDVNLVYLKYHGRTIYFLLRNLPMLANLSVSNRVFEHLRGSVMQFSSILQQLEILNLGRVYRTFSFPVKMSSLKQLVVTCLFSGYESPEWLTNIIRSAPRLQNFVLEACRLCPKFHERELQRNKTKKKLYPHLKEVVFVGFRGVPSDLEFVFHFVDNAAALDKIVIDPKTPCETPYEHKFCKNVYRKDEIIANDRAVKLLAQEVPWKIKVDFLSLF